MHEIPWRVRISRPRGVRHVLFAGGHLTILTPRDSPGPTQRRQDNDLSNEIAVSESA